MSVVNFKELFKFIVIVFVLGIFLGTAVHEIVGHGSAILLLGGQIEKVHVIGFVLYPKFYFEGFQGFGYIQSQLYLTSNQIEKGIIHIMGSMSTFLISLIFAPIFLKNNFKGIKKYVFLSFSLYFVDTFTHSIYFLDREPYRGAHFLGLSENLLWYFVIFVCFLMIIGIILKLLSDKKSKNEKLVKLTSKSLKLLPTLFLTLFVLFSVFLFSFMHYRYNQSKTIEKTLESLGIDEKIEFCLAQKTFLRNFCLFTISKTNSRLENVMNGDLCDGIDDELYRRDCYWWVYMTNKNILICDKFEKEIDVYICKGWVKKDLNECLNLKETRNKKGCIGYIMGLIDYCREQPNSMICQ